MWPIPLMLCKTPAKRVNLVRVRDKDSGGADSVPAFCEPDELERAKRTIAELQQRIEELQREKNTQPPEMRSRVVQHIYCCPNGHCFHTNKYCRGKAVAANMKEYVPCKICGHRLID